MPLSSFNPNRFCKFILLNYLSIVYNQHNVFKLIHMCYISYRTLIMQIVVERSIGYYKATAEKID